MIIDTTRFGEVEISEKSILRMPNGMLGFESSKRFVLLEDQPESDFKWLQAVDNPELAFIVVNPAEFFGDYDFELADFDAEALDITDASEAAILTTVTIDGASDCITTNLLGPVVINSRNLNAKQIVLQDERYGTKHVIGRKNDTKLVFQKAKAA